MEKEKIEIASKRCCFNVKDSGINFMLALVVPFVASLALIILFMFLAAITGNSYSNFIKTEFVQIVNLMFTPTVFFFIYFIYCKKTKVEVFKASEISFKINWLKILCVVIIGVSSVFLISPFISLVDYGFTFIGYNPENALPYVMNNGFRFVLGVLAMAVLPAICEELLFRGLIFKGLQSKFGPHSAILLSALMFTLLHGSLQQTVYQFILGMMLGYVMYYGKNIIYPILLHFVNNLIVVITSFVYTLKNIDVNTSPVYASAWDYVSPILLLILAAAIIVGVIFLMRYLNSIEKFKKNNTEGLTEEAVNNKDDSEAKQKKKTGKSKKLEILESEISIIDSKNQTATDTTSKSESIPLPDITTEDRVYVFSSIGLGLILWIVNTIMQFFGI